MAAKGEDDKTQLIGAQECMEAAEEHHQATPSKPTSRKLPKLRKRQCPDYFGVRSYLDDFYESTYKDPSVYEDEDDFRLLLHPNPKRRRCPPIWWKIFMWIGVNLLIFGILGILVGYLVPQKPIFLKVDEERNEGYADRSAVTFNTTLDVCKLIGLILFCIGGMTLAMALLFPSFLTSYCDEDPNDDTFKVCLEEDDDDEDGAPLSPIEMKIPKISKVKGVQPLRTVPEAVVMEDGSVEEYRD